MKIWRVWVFVSMLERVMLADIAAPSLPEALTYAWSRWPSAYRIGVES